MKNNCSPLVRFGLCLVLGNMANHGLAEELYMEHERHGAWELTLEAVHLGSDSFSGLIEPVIETDSGAGWGTSIGYNFTNQFLLNMSVISASPDYQIQLNTADGDRTVSGELDFMSTHFSGTWHFRPEGLTPFVTLGAGWTTVDTNIPSRAPQTDCWWDPWWGYSCANYYPTHSETSASVSAALGMRWDFHKRFFARVSYGKLWFDVDGDGSAAPGIARLEIGFRR